MTRGSEDDLWGWENGTAQRWADLSVKGQVKPRRSTAGTPPSLDPETDTPGTLAALNVPRMVELAQDRVHGFRAGLRDLNSRSDPS